MDSDSSSADGRDRIGRWFRHLSALLLYAAVLTALTVVLFHAQGVRAQPAPEDETKRLRDVALTIPVPVPHYYRHREEGWFWYRDPQNTPSLPDAQTKPEAPQDVVAPPTAADPMQRIAQQREELEQAQATAILEPTLANVRAYLEKHAALLTQSERFADAWQQVIWNTPSLDHTLVAPTGSAAYIRADVDAVDQETRLAAAAQRYGLMFFFRGDCEFCHRFAPVLRAFEERYGFEVVPVSLDGGSLPDFPDPRPNLAAAQMLSVDATPALFVIEPVSRKVAPASYGYVGFSELAQRVAYAVGEIERPAMTEGIAMTGVVP